MSSSTPPLAAAIHRRHRSSPASKVSKKKKPQCPSLAEFTTSSTVTHGAGHLQSSSRGLTTNKLLILPTGPREHSTEEIERYSHSRISGDDRRAHPSHCIPRPYSTTRARPPTLLTIANPLSRSAAHSSASTPPMAHSFASSPPMALICPDPLPRSATLIRRQDPSPAKTVSRLRLHLLHLDPLPAIHRLRCPAATTHRHLLGRRHSSLDPPKQRCPQRPPGSA